MYALNWTTIEIGGTPATIASERPRAAAAGAPWNGVPGGAVRHVLRAIASEPATSRRRWRERVRPLVDREHARLRACFEADGLVEALLRGRTRLADGAVLGLLSLARAETRSAGPASLIAPLSILALGGYGRRELAPGSDLDLLFLLADTPGERAHAEQLIGFVLAGLWDLGFEVGHASRTTRECREFAAREPTVLASLLDARLLAGSFSLSGILERDLKQMADRGLAAALAAEIAGPVPAGIRGEQEPDVKRGRGGLRDIQRLLWLARLRRGGEQRGLPAAPGPAEPPRRLVEARRFLWQVRAHLHLVADRPQDRLRCDLQPLVAARLGIGRGAAGAEALLQAYRGHTRSVSALLRAA
jgi:[protein-PII] uridylyltransferase